MEYHVMNLDDKGKLAPVAGLDATFDYDQRDRAMDVRNYIGGDTVVVSENPYGDIFTINSGSRKFMIVNKSRGSSPMFVVFADTYDGTERNRVKHYKIFKSALKKVYSIMKEV